MVNGGSKGWSKEGVDIGHVGPSGGGLTVLGVFVWCGCVCMIWMCFVWPGCVL